jgi:sulfur carrier protein
MIILNGQGSDLQPGETVVGVLERLGLDLDARGLAVAVDGEVVPREEWESVALEQDAHVEVLRAMQGG